MINNAYNLFNKDIKITLDLLNPDIKIEEYGCWYKGDVNNLLQFYKLRKKQFTLSNKSYTPNFYALAPSGIEINNNSYIEKNNFTIYHSSIPASINKAKADLIFSKFPSIKIDTGNKKKNDVFNKLLDNIVEDNQLKSLFKRAASEVSAYGSGLFTITLDNSISDYPIIQFYNTGEFILNKKYNRIISIITKNVYLKNNFYYVLLTELSKGAIEYKLYRSKAIADNVKEYEKDLEEVPLDEIEETRDLENVYFKDTEGNDFEHLIAVYIENDANGKSDYYNSIDDFMAADETYSNMMNYIRKMKPKKNITSNSLKTNQDGTPCIPGEYDTDYCILWDTNPAPTVLNPEQKDFNLQSSISGYIDSLNSIYLNIARSVGLSPASLGFDNSGANSSGEALNIRDNVTTRTRDDMITRWGECIVTLVKLLISLSSYKVDNDIITVNDYFNYDVNIEFADYNKKTFTDIINETGSLLEIGVIDLKLAIKRIFEDTGIYSENDCDELYARIKGEVQEDNSRAVEELQKELDKVNQENNEE